MRINCEARTIRHVCLRTRHSALPKPSDPIHAHDSDIHSHHWPIQSLPVHTHTRLPAAATAAVCEWAWPKLNVFVMLLRALAFGGGHQRERDTIITWVLAAFCIQKSISVATRYMQSKLCASRALLLFFWFLVCTRIGKNKIRRYFDYNTTTDKRSVKFRPLSCEQVCADRFDLAVVLACFFRHRQPNANEAVSRNFVPKKYNVWFLLFSLFRTKNK